MKRYVSRFAVEWAQCDAARIVFYPYFYVWFEQGTERLLKANDMGYLDLKPRFDIDGLPLVASGADYSSVCRLGDEVEMETRVDQIESRTLLFKHRVTRVDGMLALEGFERRVCVVMDSESAKGWKAIPIPEGMIEQFNREWGAETPITVAAE